MNRTLGNMNLSHRQRWKKCIRVLHFQNDKKFIRKFFGNSWIMHFYKQNNLILAFSAAF